MLEKLFTGEVVLLDALFGKAFHHLGLGSNGSMVGAWHPAGVLALHAGASHKNILNGVVEHVSHVEHTGNIWWRDDDGVRFTTIGLTTEQLVVKPVLIPFGLHFFGVVFTCKFHFYI